MKKANAADLQRTALANALKTSGAAVAAPQKKEEPKEVQPAAGKGKGKRNKNAEPEPAPKARDKDEDHRRQLEENELKRLAFFKADEIRKLTERKGADTDVTYVEDRDTRKPKAVSDISDYWKTDLGLIPFVPSDNVCAPEEPEDVDLNERLEFLHMFNKQLTKLLRMKFHVFWSQVIYDKTLSRCLDSYLRFCLRSHDLEVLAEEVPPPAPEDVMAVEERQVTVEISRRFLQLLVRLSRSQESSHDFISHDKFAQVVYENGIFDVPKLIDICTIYGDSNRSAVTKIVHAIFSAHPLYKDEFSSVVQHMLDGLLQCCSPLQAAARGGSAADELNADECLAFLPDMLSCFNAMFCFFPEDCVAQLMGGKLAVSGAAGDSATGASPPISDLMVYLHDSVTALRRNTTDADRVAVLEAITKLLSRLLSCVLGFHMAPRKGAAAFDDLLEWLKDQSERPVLIEDLSRNGFDNVAMEWLASGLVDDAQLDFLDELCGGPLLPKEARQTRRRPAGAASTAQRAVGAAGASSASSSSTARPSPAEKGVGSSASDSAKIREIREVVGTGYGEGFLLQCLLHYGGSVPTVVGAILDSSLPPQLSALPISLSIRDEVAAVINAAAAPVQRGLSAEDKRRIVGQAGRMDKEAAEAANRVAENVYDDDVDDTDLGRGGLGNGGGTRLGGAGANLSESEDSAASNQAESDEDGPQWTNDRGRGGKSKGKGKGPVGGKGPVQGQTIQARRKESNKAFVANHNRAAGALHKQQRGM